MSATVRSNHACSRSSRYRPGAVASQAASVVDTVPGAGEDASMAAIIPVPAFTDNYIWVVREGAGAAVVDPGDAAPVIAYLERHGLKLTVILNTHHHGDHVGGNAELCARYAPRVYGP